jgi:hypothetical protein
MYADHIIHQARVTSVIERVGDDTLEMIDDQYSRSAGSERVTGELPDRDPDLVVRTPRKGQSWRSTWRGCSRPRRTAAADGPARPILRRAHAHRPGQHPTVR